MSKESNTLNMIQSHALINLILAEYVKSGLNDVEFAEEASKELGFPLNKGHIATRRHEFGIESNVNQSTTSNKLNIEARIKVLEYAVGHINETLKLKNLGFFKESLLSE